jgi:hypothetical protein
MTQRTITTTIPIFNRNLFVDQYAFKSDTLVLSSKINEVVEVNDQKSTQISNVTYCTVNPLNALYIGNSNVTNSNFSQLSGCTRNIETTLIANITNINNNANNILTKKDMSEYNTEKLALESDILARKLISEYDTEKTTLENSISERKLISEYDTEKTALETDISAKKLIREYYTEKTALESDILTRKLISEYDTEKTTLESNILARK